MANQTNNNQDVDLAMVSGKIRGYFTRANDSFFDGILYLKRNILWVALVIIAGIALGYYMDQGKKVYEQRVVVIPNFDSVDYLYDNVNLISQKIKESDSDFLNKIGLGGARIGDIKIEPVIEIYDFIDDRDDEQQRRMQVFKLLAEGDNIEDVLEDMPTARNYPKHLITIYTSGNAERKTTVDPIMDYLNSDSYFLEMKVEYTKSLQAEIAANDTTIAQINNMLNDFSGTTRKGADNLIYYNDNTPMNEVIKLKNSLLKKQAKNKVNLLNYDKIVKESSVILNTKRKSFISGRMKFVVPLVFFFFLFVPIAMFVSYYKRQVNKRKIIITNE
ncbi:hypothetical protein [Flavobacterium litorale]|uniref:Polysaccharide chain length determinant N-terminal domain-containing protein n=1 Tax=Flavobacterium litorale TaxID=2856519 RepID=A0ABX8V887_9FLAO|nr:hypothetical protein [Flavobacterium litorale]QYJ69052.1 hypothetical protein K1I41_03965 [Flavobacterium litorale]